MPLSISRRKIGWITLRGIFVVLENIARMKKYRTYDVLRSHFIKNGFMEN
jgi:hypothetical protein